MFQEEFCVTDDKSKKKPRRIFLFEQSIIFSKPVGDGNSPSYQYKKCMKVDEPVHLCFAVLNMCVVLSDV